MLKCALFFFLCATQAQPLSLQQTNPAADQQLVRRYPAHHQTVTPHLHRQRITCIGRPVCRQLPPRWFQAMGEVG